MENEKQSIHFLGGIPEPINFIYQILSKWETTDIKNRFGDIYEGFIRSFFQEK